MPFGRQESLIFLYYLPAKIYSSMQLIMPLSKSICPIWSIEYPRGINKIRARCRMHGVTISRATLRDPVSRLKWLLKTKHNALANQLKMLWIGYDATVQQVKFAKRQLSMLSKKYDIIQQWSLLPGIRLWVPFLPLEPFYKESPLREWTTAVFAMPQ